MDPIKEINSFTRECYNKIAKIYFSLFKNELDEKEFDRKLLDEFARQFNSESLICDAGCGPVANTGRYLFDKGLNVIGTDISDECIRIASANNPEMNFIRKDFFEWDFPEEHFDGIICYHSVMYTPRQFADELFGIFRRYLKPGGKILIAAKEGNSEGYENDVLGISTKIYTSYFTGEEIKNLLLNNGFQLNYFHVREPLDNEIKIRRIYAIGEKK